MTTWTREETGGGTGTELSKFEQVTVDNIVINGTNIGHTDDLDLLALSSGTLTINGSLAATGGVFSDTLVAGGAFFNCTAAAVFSSTVQVGQDDTGFDVTFWGDTASNYLLWDTSANSLKINGTSAGQEQLVLSNNEAGNGKAPLIGFYRDSASPANNDDLGGFKFYGKDAGGATTEYATMFADIVNTVDDAERGGLWFSVKTETAGGAANVIKTGLKIQGTSTNDRVDLEIPNGSLLMSKSDAFLTVGTSTRKDSAYITCAGAAPSIALVPASAGNDEGAQLNWYGVNNSGGTDWSGYNHYIDTLAGAIRLISITPGGTLGASWIWKTVTDTTDPANPAYENLLLRGTGVTGKVRLESWMHHSAGALSVRDRATVTIASGVGNIVKNTAGSFCQFTSESSTSDDLDFITVNGGNPDVGTELWIVPTDTHTITVRTGNHASVTDAANAFRGRKDDGTVIKSYTLSSQVQALHCIFNGSRWIIVGGHYASITT